MGRLDCIHRGFQTRVLECGCPDGVKLFACGNQAVESDDCALIKDMGKRGAAINAAGVPDCLTCPCRVPPPPKQRLPLIGSQSIVSPGEPLPVDVPLPNWQWAMTRARSRKAEVAAGRLVKQGSVVVQSSVDTEDSQPSVRET